MNRLEYIPGDLVSVYVGIKKYIVEVIGTENENEVLSYQIKFQNGEIQYADKDNIVQIPLTLEILEKNGWYGATHSKQSDDSTKILYKTFKRKGYPTIKVSQDLKITCELSPFIVKLESVSDLQHLLFGLGINHEMEV